MTIRYTTIPYGGGLYAEALKLRTNVLRAPLGLTYTEEELAPETDDTHIAALRDGKVVAYLFLRAVDEHTVKLRQVVVAEHMQGVGVGTGLILFAQQVASDEGYTQVTLHARETAIAFYEKLGFTKEGDAVELVTLPHWLMGKKL